MPAECIHLGRKLAAIAARGPRTELTFADGTEVEADLVIGADGVHSLIREHVVGPDQARFTGRVAYRTTYPLALLRDVEMTTSRTKWWGTGPAHRDLPGDAGRGVFHHQHAGAGRLDHARNPGRRRATSARLRAAFSHFHPDVRAVLAAAPEVHKWGIFERDPLPTWRRGRVVLLGDACHPMTPYMASGAGMALEDAAVLARCLVEFGDADTALRIYEATRKPRTSVVQQGSSANNWMRNETNPDWLYGYDPWTAPLDEPVAA